MTAAPQTPRERMDEDLAKRICFAIGDHHWKHANEKQRNRYRAVVKAVSNAGWCPREDAVRGATDEIVKREARRLEILDWLQGEIGTAWGCTNCGYSTYHDYHNECAECGQPFPLLNLLAFKLHASHTDNEEYLADAIRALLPAKPATPNGWLPIESAPKDGSKVLLWVVHPDAEWSDSPREHGYEGACIGYWSKFNGGGWVWNGMCGKITKWHPLPNEPRAAAPEKETQDG